VLGADAAGSDHLVTPTLARGTGGTFVFELVDFGVTAGGSYDLVEYDSLSGFDVSDFSFSGVAGTFGLQGGHLQFTAAAVPEPGTGALWLLGLLGLGHSCRGRRSMDWGRIGRGSTVEKLRIA
jgi:hypothetical protein